MGESVREHGTFWAGGAIGIAACICICFGRLNVRYICGSWNSGVWEGLEAWDKRDKWAEKNVGGM